jgi:hypothetical protein
VACHCSLNWIMSLGTRGHSLKALGSRLRDLNSKTYRVPVILLTAGKFDDACGIISPANSLQNETNFPSELGVY